MTGFATMRRISWLMAVTMFLLATFNPAAWGAAQPATLAAYEAGLDRGCKTDADCAIKDVHNCCGYYPACVNKAAIVQPELVQTLCAKEDIGSICGYPEISACHCVQNTCRESASGGGSVQPVER